MGLHMLNNKYLVGETAVPSSDYNGSEHLWERDSFLICINAGLKAAQQKAISYARVSAITQEPNKNHIAFVEGLKEALQKFINLESDTSEGQVILKDKFLSQYASDIRIRLQQLQQQDPAASLYEMVQTATNTCHNREQEREAKAQERERRKEKRHAQMLVALQGSTITNPGSLNNKA